MFLYAFLNNREKPSLRKPLPHSSPRMNLRKRLGSSAFPPQYLALNCVEQHRKDGKTRRPLDVMRVNLPRYRHKQHDIRAFGERRVLVFRHDDNLRAPAAGDFLNRQQLLRPAAS